MHEAVTFTNEVRGAHHTPAGEALALLKHPGITPYLANAKRMSQAPWIDSGTKDQAFKMHGDSTYATTQAPSQRTQPRASRRLATNHW